MLQIQTVVTFNQLDYEPNPNNALGLKFVPNKSGKPYIWQRLLSTLNSITFTSTPPPPSDQNFIKQQVFTGQTTAIISVVVVGIDVKELGVAFLKADEVSRAYNSDFFSIGNSPPKYRLLCTLTHEIATELHGFIP